MFGKKNEENNKNQLHVLYNGYEDKAVKRRELKRLNEKILSITKASYLAGDSPEEFHKKVGAAIEELGDYIKENI